MFDQLQQHNVSGDNIARDKIINNYLLGSVDYQQLMAEIKDGEDLLAGIAPERLDLRLKHAAKLEELRKQLEDFKVQVFRIYEQISRIPINTERLQRAKAHFEKGEFREADAVLKAEEIERDVERLKLEQTAAKDKLAAIERDLADKANEFMLKAQLSLVTPLAEGEDRFQRTEGYFTQALAAARIAEVLHAYASFLTDYNAFSKSEPLYQEALQHYRKNAETEPKAFLPDVAMTLNNLAAVHYQTQDYGLALKEYEEALTIRRSLAETDPKAFLPNVAGILNNLANMHSDTQEYALSIEEYKETLKLYRSLAETEPEDFLSHIAMVLNNMANLHADTQDYSLAQHEFEDALKLYRSLAETEPKVFLPYLAGTLNNLATLHADIKEYGLAPKEYEEALKFYRRLAKAAPNAFLPNVAGTLNNLACLHANIKEYGIALKKFEEALTIRRSLAEAEPKVFLKELTETLINLSIFYLYAVPDRAKSVAYAQEARDILVPLCKRVPYLQSEFDRAEQVLAMNEAKPSA